MKDEEKKEQLDGDAGVQRLFQQIYAGKPLTPGMLVVPTLLLPCWILIFKGLLTPPLVQRR